MTIQNTLSSLSLRIQQAREDSDWSWSFLQWINALYKNQFSSEDEIDSTNANDYVW